MVLAMGAGPLADNDWAGKEGSSRWMLWDDVAALFMHPLVDEKRNAPSQTLQNLTYLIENFTRIDINRVRFLLLEDTSDGN
jgi:hypothetical protein